MEEGLGCELQKGAPGSRPACGFVPRNRKTRVWDPHMYTSQPHTDEGANVSRAADGVVVGSSAQERGVGPRGQALKLSSRLLCEKLCNCKAVQLSHTSGCSTCQ